MSSAGMVALVLLSFACSGGTSSDATADAARNAAEAARAAADAAQQAGSAAQEASVAAQNAAASGSATSEDVAAAARAAQVAATAAETAAESAAAASAAATDAAMIADEGVGRTNAVTQAADQAAGLAKQAAQAAEAASAAADAAAAATARQSSESIDSLRAAETAALTAADAAERAAKVSEDALMAANSAQMALDELASSLSTNGSAGTLVVYSGRSESLVAPIIEQFREATGIDVRVKYGSTSAIAATLLEEGDNSPADVFWAQDPGALVVLSDRFAPLPSDAVLAVPEWARAHDGAWVGITGRARVIVYNTDLSPDELPSSIEELTEPQWKGRVGWPPTNASFRIMVTAMRHMWGEDRTRKWLEGMVNNDVGVYPKNTPIVDAAGKSEVDVGLVNHYYLHRFIAEHGDGFGARNLFLNDGGPGSLVMIAGAGILDTSPNPENAERFIRFLLSTVAQQYFAASVYEYPLIKGVKTHHLLPPIESLVSPEIDFALLNDLVGTEELLRSVGVIP